MESRLRTALDAISAESYNPRQEGRHTNGASPHSFQLRFGEKQT